MTLPDSSRPDPPRAEVPRFGTPFGTPLLDYAWPDSAGLNAELRAAILAEEARSPGAALTNVGGWHSESGDLGFCGEAGQALVRRMLAMVDEATSRLFAEYGRAPDPLDWSLHAWANVNRRGDFNKLHTHPGATWSGVYYVDAGAADGEAEAAINLVDPCAARAGAFFPELVAGDILFPPTPGLMILFPSYLPHAVAPHRGAGTRISVAFNARKDPYP